MNDEARLALDSLEKQNEGLKKGSVDPTPDIEPAKNYEKRDVIQNDDGTWGETITEEKLPAKSSKARESEQVEGFKRDIANYRNLAKIGDNKVLQILGEINDKKLGILTTVNAAVSAGCSVLVGDGTWGPVTVGGVVLGPANTQSVYNTSYPKLSNDIASVYKYDDLDNYQSNNPFAGISSSNLTQNNVGTGFSTGCIVNTGATLEAGGNTQFKTITTDIPLSGACAGYLATVNSLASEIDALRDSLGTDWAAGSYVGVLKDTIQVKDKKTESQTYLWSYKNTDAQLTIQQESNNSLINSIESQSEYQ
jgi:hypothetical protein